MIYEINTDKFNNSDEIKTVIVFRNNGHVITKTKSVIMCTYTIIKIYI
jgi:hypothetical protein